MRSRRGALWAVLAALPGCGADPAGAALLAATCGAACAPARTGDALAVIAASGGWPRPERCPTYLRSPVHRRRAHQVAVGPGDDWIRAIERARPDTEVVLRRGEYRLGRHYAVRIPGGVTVRGETGHPDDVVVRGRGYGPESEGLMITGPDVTIAELSVTAVRNHAVAIKGELGAHRPHLYRLHLYDVGTQHVKLTPGGAREGLVACSEIHYTPGAVKGDYVDAIDLHGAVDWTLRDNFIHGITGDGSGCEVDTSCGRYTSGPAILVWNGARGTVVERNLLVDNFRNIAFGLGKGHQGGVIRNNFVYRRRGGDAGIELQGAAGVRVLHNTVRVAGYPGAIEVRESRDCEIVNNLLSAPVWDRGAATFRAAGNIGDAADADFLDPAGFRLQPASRARGAGLPAADAGADLDGRPRDGRFDVGCAQLPE